MPGTHRRSRLVRAFLAILAVLVTGGALAVAVPADAAAPTSDLSVTIRLIPEGVNEYNVEMTIVNNGPDPIRCCALGGALPYVAVLTIPENAEYFGSRGVGSKQRSFVSPFLVLDSEEPNNFQQHRINITVLPDLPPGEATVQVTTRPAINDPGNGSISGNNFASVPVVYED
jgi:hypothetical protein